MSNQKDLKVISDAQHSPPNSLEVIRHRSNWDQIGRFYYGYNQPARTVPEHHHQQHALLISLSGTVWLNNGDGHSQCLPIGGIAITPATITHAAILDDHSEFIILYLEPSFVARSVYDVTSKQYELSLTSSSQICSFNRLEPR